MGSKAKVMIAKQSCSKTKIIDYIDKIEIVFLKHYAPTIYLHLKIIQGENAAIYKGP